MSCSTADAQLNGAGMVETEFSVVRYRGNVQAATDEYKGLDPRVLHSITGIHAHVDAVVSSDW